MRPASAASTAIASAGAQTGIVDRVDAGPQLVPEMLRVRMHALAEQGDAAGAARVARVIVAAHFEDAREAAAAAPAARAP